MSKLQKQFLIDQFGMQRGRQLYVSLAHLMNHNMENHTNEDKKRKMAIRKMILPSISLYSLLQNEAQLSKEEACSMVQKFLWEYGAVRSRELYSKLATIPAFFTIFKKVCKMNAKSGIWQVSIRKDNSEEFIFDIHQCLWYDTCCFYQCPELCRIFCGSDYIMYQGFDNKIRFIRSKTLGEGGDCCNFQFIKK